MSIFRYPLPQKGFLLVEVMLSLIVISSIATMVAYYSWQSMQQQANHKQRSKALRYLCNQCEQVRLRGAVDSADVCADGITYTTSVGALYAPMQQGATVDIDVPGAQLVTLQARWQAGSGVEQSCMLSMVIINKESV